MLCALLFIAFKPLPEAPIKKICGSQETNEYDKVIADLHHKESDVMLAGAMPQGLTQSGAIEDRLDNDELAEEDGQTRLPCCCQSIGNHEGEELTLSAKSEQLDGEEKFLL